MRHEPRRGCRDEPVEVRAPPRHGHAEPGGRNCVVALDAGERALELDLRVAQIGAVDREPRGADLVVERRDEHLDVVRAHDAHPVEQVLLGQRRRRSGALRRAARELVDELVDAGGADRAGSGADDELLPCQLHQTFGSNELERAELPLQVLHDLVERERGCDVLGERVERPVAPPEQRRVPGVGVLVDRVEPRRDAAGRDRAAWLVEARDVAGVGAARPAGRDLRDARDTRAG